MAAEATQFTLPPSTLAPAQIAQLRSACGNTLVALEEMQGLVSWGGDAGIVGWPTLLASHQRLLSLLSVLNHHLSPPSGSSRAAATSLSQLLVHPGLVADQAGEAWLQALLAIPTSDHLRPPPPPAEGTAEEHEIRRQRAVRVVELLSEEHDWRGRVGLVHPGDKEANDEENGEEGLFGDDEMEEDRKPAAPPPLAGAWTTEEQESELRRLLGSMARLDP